MKAYKIIEIERRYQKRLFLEKTRSDAKMREQNETER